jgi:arginine decarboxylase
LFQAEIKGKFKIGIASEEEPKFEFYTSCLELVIKHCKFYKKQIQDNDKLELKMLHFSSIQVLMIRLYWNELVKCIKVYIALKKRMSGIR